MLSCVLGGSQATILLDNFLRDELRSLLKSNHVSYHRGGPQNMMKSKAEMANNLIELLNADGAAPKSSDTKLI